MPNRIRALRLARGLTLKECATAIHITPQALQKAETRNHLSTLRRYDLAEFFGCDPRELENPRRHLAA
jgi:transcriptional regulator with XRE-family HTH domain